MTHSKLDKNWIVFYFPEFHGRLMHIYHNRCSVSTGVSPNTKYVKCPKCKTKLPSWLIDSAKHFIKLHQLADLNIQI